VASPLARRDTPPVPDTESGASSFGNCETALTGPYCSQCGEKKLAATDYSIAHLAEEALEMFAHFDSKFLRTLKVLFAKPGELSKAYFRGGRSRYTKPLTLFIIINIVFFVAQPHTELLHDKYVNYMKFPNYAGPVHAHLLATKEPEQAYAARFNTNLQNEKKSLLIVSVPLLAIVMALVFFGTGRTYAEHLVFSIQVYTFMLIYLGMAAALFFLLTLLLRVVAPTAEPIVKAIANDRWLVATVITGLTVYMYLALRRAYETSRARAAVSAFILAWTVAVLIGVYHEAVFFATFWIT
jgi:hypothetical protein